ncbi:MAG: DUF2335 domain-containing protein [Acidobacteriota bacterium]|jgi:uncharacterized membrane protein
MVKHKNKFLPHQQNVIPQQPTQLTYFAAEGFSGPLPHPSLLIKYNEAFPGCAERIVGMAERQSSHRQAIERKVIYSNVVSERLGQILGFIVAIVVVLSGVYLTMHDKPTQGIVAILSPLIGLVLAFIYGKRHQQKQLSSKNPQVRPPTEQH